MTVNVLRRCRRPGCPHYAVATLTFMYSDSTAIIGPLAETPDPHAWDLCLHHAGRVTTPRGWQLIRHPGPFSSPPEDSDLIALAEAVCETGDYSQHTSLVSNHDTTSPQWVSAENHSSLVSTSAKNTARKRHHLRVLPDLPE